jgi:hypothetical protein
MDAAISGQGGHATTYTAAVHMVWGFSLSPDHALRLLMAHYNPRCQPPWTETEMRHKCDDAYNKPHDMPRGWLLKTKLKIKPLPAPVADPVTDPADLLISAEEEKEIKKAISPEEQDIYQALFVGLRDKNPRAREILDHKFPNNKYDIELASILRKEGWKDEHVKQGIIDRNKPRPTTDEYVKDVMSDSLKTHSETNIGSHLEKLLTGITDKAARKEIIRIEASKWLSVKEICTIKDIHSVYMWITDPEIFCIETLEFGKIEFGDTQSWRSQKPFSNSFYKGTGMSLPAIKSGEWSKFHDILSELLEKRDAGLNATEAGDLTDKLQQYFEAFPPTEDFNEAIISKHPYKNSNGYSFYFPHFNKWYLRQGGKIKDGRISKCLKDLGFEYGRVGYKSKRMWRWRVPTEFLEEECE